MNTVDQEFQAHEAALHMMFIEKVMKRDACIGVIGLGYIGLPLILGFHGRDFRTLGIDVDQQKIDALEAGQSYIKHIPSDRTEQLLESDRFAATTDFSRLVDADAILICVPTPLTRHLEPDLAYVESTAKSMAPHLKWGHLIVLESTTYPGTTRELMVPILEKGSGLKADKDFFVAYSPEREDPGNIKFDAQTTPKVVGAATPIALEMAKELYATLVPKVVTVSSPEVAEAVKLTENIFRAVNIAMVNELKVIYGEMGIDIWEVIDAAKTKPFGFMPFYPGPGLGGHCIPIDPFYLTWKAREFGLSTRFIELAGQINRNMPLHVVTTLRDALSDRQHKALAGSRILIVGIAYKKNVGDLRESPSLTLIDLLEERGATTDYHDPFIPVITPTREHPKLAGRQSIDLETEQLKIYDAVLVATDHDNVDYGLIGESAALVVDTRNAFFRAGLSGENILKA